MDSYFDHVASSYDKDFTHTEIGMRQRRIVYDFLEGKLDLWESVLEVNCGTGEDAIWLAQHGKAVLATDISTEMIRIAKAKAVETAGKVLKFEVLDLKDIATREFGEQFDLVFSNFGGLNCLNPDELVHFLKTLKQKVLQPNGSAVLVIMSKGSIWESLFYLRKLNFRKAFRRYTNKALEVNVDGMMVPTYYYNPSFFQSLKDDFIIESVQTTGFFLPPSYLEPIFSKRPRLLRLLFRLENKVKNTRFLAAYSDHYLIELKAR